MFGPDFFHRLFSTFLRLLIALLLIESRTICFLHLMVRLSGSLISLLNDQFWTHSSMVLLHWQLGVRKQADLETRGRRWSDDISDLFPWLQTHLSTRSSPDEVCLGSEHNRNEHSFWSYLADRMIFGVHFDLEDEKGVCLRLSAGSIQQVEIPPTKVRTTGGGRYFCLEMMSLVLFIYF